MLHYSRLKTIIVLGICLLGAILSVPNVLPRSTLDSMPSWLHLRAMSLGLDLQGGSHLLLEVDVKAVLAERTANLTDVARAQLRKENVGYTNLALSGDAVVLTLRDVAQLDKARAAIREVERDLDITVTGAQMTLRYTEQAVRDRKRAAVDQSIEIVRRRVDETGTKEPSIQRQGEDRIVVQLPGVDDPERIKALIGKTAKLTFRMVDTTVSDQDVATGRVPAGSDLLASEEREGRGAPRYAVRKRVMVSGDSLVDAQPTFQNGEAVVSFRFDSAGGKRFGEATRENVGKPFAIVLDNKVISAPVIREPILGGSGVISGSFTVQSAQDLALLLRAGALPAPLTVIEERSVGPGLGADSILAGQIACVAGLVLVVCFMVLGYGTFGLFANIALLVNLLLLIAAMSMLQATLTLPGIAGIVLTMGMSVDANVLIYERIREELRSGRSPLSSIEIGFDRAQATIVDSNLTSLIAAILLYAFGSGPVRGFAVTLGIGIVASMFTAVMVTRLLIAVWFRRTRPQVLPV